MYLYLRISAVNFTHSVVKQLQVIHSITPLFHLGIQDRIRNIHITVYTETRMDHDSLRCTTHAHGVMLIYNNVSYAGKSAFIQMDIQDHTFDLLNKYKS